MNCKATNEQYKVLAMENSASTLCKSINSKHDLPGSWLVHQLATLSSIQEKTPSNHAFISENSRKAAKKNTKFIKYTDYDVGKAIEKQKGSILTPGSKFHHIDHLKKLLRYHPDWPEVRKIIQKGCNYHLTPEKKLLIKKSNLVGFYLSQLSQ